MRVQKVSWRAIYFHFYREYLACGEIIRHLRLRGITEPLLCVRICNMNLIPYPLCTAVKLEIQITRSFRIPRVLSNTYRSFHWRTFKRSA